VTPQPVGITGTDERLIAALRIDGRATYAELGTVTGLSPVTVRRRIGELRAAGALFFDVDLDSAALGATTQALRWMSVAPAHLDPVATDLAGHPELAFVAATTGTTNLLANVLCPDVAALHDYLIGRLALPAITAIETAPVLHTLKGAGPARP
jgi:DNA-binding Lrp family transcriptional regulator